MSEADEFVAQAEAEGPLQDKCLICGVKAGQECRPVSKASPPLNRRFHLERETARMHPRRTA